jgi:hypothetical protein
VTGLRLRGARTVVERFCPHCPNQHYDEPAGDLASLGDWQALKRSRARGWKFLMQLVKAPRGREVGPRHGAGR